MRGAVLHKLGLDFVKNRIMRSSYGISMNRKFQTGFDPEIHKVEGFDGNMLCEGVMDWYAKKVSAMFVFSLNSFRGNPLPMGL